MKELGKLFIDEDLSRVGISPFLIDKNNFPIGYFRGHHMGGTQLDTTHKLELLILILRFLMLKIFGLLEVQYFHPLDTQIQLYQ